MLWWCSVKNPPYCGGRWRDRWDTLLLALFWWTPCHGTLVQPAPHLQVSRVRFPPVGVTMLIRSDPSWEDHILLITADKCAVKDIVCEQLVPKTTSWKGLISHQIYNIWQYMARGVAFEGGSSWHRNTTSQIIFNERLHTVALITVILLF